MGNFKEVGTIRETMERARESGYSISEYSLRRWLATGAIPCRRCGNKYLIPWSGLEKFLLCEDGGDIHADTLKNALHGFVD